MFQRRGSKLCIILAIVLGVAAKPSPPPGAPWASYVGKPVYSRSLGPPPISGMGTITVPYMPKSPMFPKFVDPKTMISKKTDLLNNLFGGLGPVDNSGSVGDTSVYSTLGAADTFGKTQSTIPDNAVPYKRGLFGPMISPFAPMGPMSPMGPMGPMFNPIASKFGMMGTKFPFGGVGSTMDADSYDSSDSSTRRKRSVVGSTTTDDEMETFLKSFESEPSKESTSTKEVGPPPPFPGLTPIAEEAESSKAKTPLLKLFGPPASVTGFMPGSFSPFTPVDPGMMMAKKTAFLDTLFKNLATTTPSPAMIDVPTPKSTIVPPNFWLPSSVIPGPTEYSQKVSEFLNKLFDSLALNMTLNSTTPDDSGAASIKVARSVDDFTTISVAKDAIVDSILSELGVIKGSMISTLNDLITYEKTVAVSASAKKPFKPFAPGLWPAPAVDATLPFQQRMTVLSQVFDMLTDLQRNITTAVQEAIKAKAAVTEDSVVSNDFGPMGGFSIVPEPTSDVFNTTLLDAIRSKLASINIPASASVPSSGFGFVPPKFARMVPKAPTSVWVSYPSSAASSKREVSEVEDYPFSEDRSNRNQYARAVNMQMHQGYQSMPPGTVETVQAGGGSVPGHQGGGIKLLNAQNYDVGSKWAEWADYVKNQYQGNRHHHNHH